MAIRKDIEDFVALGALPDSEASEESIARRQAQLQKIKRPVTDQEAALLVSCFGPDDCYGLAWTLLHLIESAPGGSPLREKPAADASEWLHRLWESAQRGALRQ